jgi:3-methyladenine DNA glycosylase Tag
MRGNKYQHAAAGIIRSRTRIEAIRENGKRRPLPMNIDQRIETLTQSVELLSQMHQENEKRYNRMFEQLVSMNERLVRIAEDNEGRIRRLEQNGG